MLFLLTNRPRPTLTATEYGELAALAKEFYASIPADVEIRGEWAAADRSHNYTLLEAPESKQCAASSAVREIHRDNDRAGCCDLGMDGDLTGRGRMQR